MPKKNTKNTQYLKKNLEKNNLIMHTCYLSPEISKLIEDDKNIKGINKKVTFQKALYEYYKNQGKIK